MLGAEKLPDIHRKMQIFFTFFFLLFDCLFVYLFTYYCIHKFFFLICRLFLFGASNKTSKPFGANYGRFLNLVDREALTYELHLVKIALSSREFSVNPPNGVWFL